MSILTTPIQIDVGPQTPVERRRARRVAVLLVAAVLLSLGDLYITLSHVYHTGMIESNPMAAPIVYSGSVLSVVLFKLGTVGISAGLLLMMRRHVAAELGAWAIVAILTLLTLHWSNYNDMVADEFHQAHSQQLPGIMRTEALAGR